MRVEGVTGWKPVPLGDREEENREGGPGRHTIGRERFE